MPGHMAADMPSYMPECVLKHVPKHVPDKHVPGQMIKQMAHAVLIT